MLQRIQSVFMFFAALSMIAMLFFPLWGKSSLQEDKSNADQYEYALLDAMEVRYELRSEDGSESKLLGTKPTFPIAIAAITAAAVMFFSISRFKNRLTQVKLNALFSLLVAGVLCGTYYYTTKANLLFEPEFQGTFLPGFYLPIIAMFNNFLANRFIRKDEKLVRSADRIR